MAIQWWQPTRNPHGHAQAWFRVLPPLPNKDGQLNFFGYRAHHWALPDGRLVHLPCTERDDCKICNQVNLFIQQHNWVMYTKLAAKFGYAVNTLVLDDLYNPANNGLVHAYFFGDYYSYFDSDITSLWNVTYGRDLLEEVRCNNREFTSAAQSAILAGGDYNRIAHVLNQRQDLNQASTPLAADQLDRIVNWTVMSYA